MEVAMRFSSRPTVLLLAVISLLLPNGAFSNNSTLFPQDFANQACELPSGKEGVCVYGYLCKDSIINIDGNGIIDLRVSDVCEDYFLKCCSKETPCMENTGTCVSASNCGANLNDPKYKEYKQTDECDWSGYKCCPKDKIGQASKQDEIPSTESSDVQINSIEQYESCDDNAVCVPDDQCLVNPDGVNILESRASICSGANQTCCPKDKLKGNNEDYCSESGGVCVPESDCPATFSSMIDIRISQCDEPGFVCCKQEINKACNGGKGKCTPKCLGTKYKDPNGECEGLKCCATLSATTSSLGVSTSTTQKPADNVNEGKACANNLGQCTSVSCDPKTRPKYRVRKNECGDLNCCGLEQTPPVDDVGNEGKACNNNLGKCTSGKCVGTNYSNRRNECGGLNCCGLDQITPVDVSSTTTRKPVDVGNEGKACYSKLGKCTSENCLGTKYSDRKNECGGLNCCGIEEVEPDTEPPVDNDPSCNSVGGKCIPDGNCFRKTDTSVEDCNDDEVCCVQEEARPGTGPEEARPGTDPEELIKDCGYRNGDGVNFITTGGFAGESQFGEFPWMVAIMVEEKNKVKFTCGGSLIDPEVVLTSADCVKSYRRTPDKLIVRAGEWDMGTTSEPIRHQERRVAKIKSHPGFKATTLVNNIALLFLDDKIDLGKTINTVCLPPQNFVIKNGYVTASGWGSTPQDRTKYQQILKSIDLQFIERPDCERVLRKGTKNRSFKLHNSFMCAGGLSGVDTCTGDAGSPIVFPIPDDFKNRFYAVGMVSCGVGCGRAGMPAAYTDVAFFRDWIDNEMHLEGLHDCYYTYSVSKYCPYSSPYISEKQL